MKALYYCPYCDQTSTRKWNLSTHIRRKHQGSSDPFDMPSRVVLTDPYYHQRMQSQPDFSNSSLPQIDLSDPTQVKERLTKFKNLLEELSRLSRRELISLLNAIFNFPQFK